MFREMARKKQKLEMPQIIKILKQECFRHSHRQNPS